MKFFESSLRPVSADKRLVAREVAFNAHVQHECRESRIHYANTLSCAEPQAAVSLYSRNHRIVSAKSNQDDQIINDRQRNRKLRANQRLQSAEKKCRVKRDREAARLQLESVWLKKQIVAILRKQQVIECLA